MLAEADLAVVAAPVTVLPSLVEDVLARTGDRATVTDIGSTKDWSAKLPERFVGGHPVCGREGARRRRTRPPSSSTARPGS